MNAAIEEGLKTYAATALAAYMAALDPDPAVDPMPVLDTGTSAALMPAAAQTVIFNVKNCPNDAGKLFTADLEVIVSTPAIDLFPVAKHRALVAAVEPIMAPANEATFSEAIHDEADAVTAGIYFAGPVEVRNGDRWNTILNYKLGITRD